MLREAGQEQPVPMEVPEEQEEVEVEEEEVLGEVVGGFQPP